MGQFLGSWPNYLHHNNEANPVSVNSTCLGIRFILFKRRVAHTGLSQKSTYISLDNTAWFLQLGVKHKVIRKKCPVDLTCHISSSIKYRTHLRSDLRRMHPNSITNVIPEGIVSPT